MLLDSNILIYSGEPEGEFLDPWVKNADAFISSVSRIEVLGFPRWGLVEEAQRLRLVSLSDTLPELSLNDLVIFEAIALRRAKKMSLGDSIIAATALCFGLPLITRNDADFRHIAGLVVVNPFPGELV